MKVLVIPDVHLRAGMFECADAVLRQNLAERAVCLMDLPDDWFCERKLNLYEGVYNAAVAFQQDHPDTLWCRGNHDMSYMWLRQESGFSPLAIPVVQDGMRKLEAAAGENLQFVHLIDNVMFSHGGVTRDFVLEHVCDSYYQNMKKVLDALNRLGANDMWNDFSPLWFRPTYKTCAMYKARMLLHVVGHTPVPALEIRQGVLICDTFSTSGSGKPIGPADFAVVDTVAKTFEAVPSGYKHELRFF